MLKLVIINLHVTTYVRTVKSRLTFENIVSKIPEEGHVKSMRIFRKLGLTVIEAKVSDYV